MHRTRSIGILLLSSGIGFMVATGCGVGAGTERTGESLESVAVAGSGGSVSLTFQSDWTQGYCANVTVSNTGSTASTGWQTVIDLNQSSVTSLWGAASTQSGALL